MLTVLSEGLQGQGGEAAQYCWYEAGSCSRASCQQIPCGGRSPEGRRVCSKDFALLACGTGPTRLCPDCRSRRFRLCQPYHAEVLHSKCYSFQALGTRNNLLSTLVAQGRFFDLRFFSVGLCGAQAPSFETGCPPLPISPLNPASGPRGDGGEGRRSRCHCGACAAL